jgi:xanthine dehydrogenase accessory factor
MTDLDRILALWRELDTDGADYVLATVIAVEGPSYRKPGALMLLAADGRRVGTISGGCLEAQVASRAWWLTGNGPTVQRYSTAEDDGDRPYGSGCGGIVILLLERPPTARALLDRLADAFERRIPLSVATIVEGHELGLRAFATPLLDSEEFLQSRNALAGQEEEPLYLLAESSLAAGRSTEGTVQLSGGIARAWADFRPARPALWVFGAGDDAQPILRLANELGWFVSISDGRSHLATRDRFQTADAINILPIARIPALNEAPPNPFAAIHRQDAAVVMTHSFEQDAKVLAMLLSSDVRPSYIGVLGPQRRTRELLSEAALLLGIPPRSATIDEWMAELHAPTGLDLGADSPETIALSILAEIQKTRTSASGLPLRHVRGSAVTLAG